MRRQHAEQSQELTQQLSAARKLLSDEEETSRGLRRQVANAEAEFDSRQAKMEVKHAEEVAMLKSRLAAQVCCMAQIALLSPE